MSTTKESLLNEIERLDEEKIRRTLEFIQNLREERTLDHLKSHPAIKAPSESPGGFRKVKPAPTKGTPASKLLIGDRR